MEFNVNILLEQFFNNTVQMSIPWLIVMAAVIILDLIVGIKKAHFVGDEVKISTAFRRTINKTVGYFWVVVTVSLIDAATMLDFKITTWACLIVCVLELLSTASNFLKIKGYKFNKEKGFDLFARKTFEKFNLGSFEKGEIGGLIEKDSEAKTIEKKEGEL